jgi:hypothetical protein
LYVNVFRASGISILRLLNNGENMSSIRSYDCCGGVLMKRYIVAGFVAFSFVVLVSVTLSAQQGSGRMGGRGGVRSEGRGTYDPAQAEITTGEIIAVKDIEFNRGRITGVGAELKTDSQTVLVYLGPHIYVDLQNVRINVGDTVEVKGVNVLLDGQQAVLAGEVRKGDDVLRLRDDNGMPLWAGKRQGGRRGN